MLNTKFSIHDRIVFILQGIIFFLYSFHSINLYSPSFGHRMSAPETNIELTITEDTHYNFTGVLINNMEEEKEYSYQLSGKRSGTSGTSNTSQGGVVMAKPGEKTTLSSFTINISPGDEWEVILDIYHEDLHVAADTLSHNP